MAKTPALQRAIGVLQILGGALYSVYGGAYGGRGGGSYLIGSGIANVGGSKYGTAYRGKLSGLVTDLAGSTSAAGAAYGLQTGFKKPVEYGGAPAPLGEGLGPLKGGGFGQQPPFQDELADYIQQYSTSPSWRMIGGTGEEEAGAMAYQRLRDLIIGDSYAQLS